MPYLSEQEKAELFYHQVVKNENDLVGYIAYCYYKEAKVAYIVSERKRTGQPPSNEELRAWQRNQCLHSGIQGYVVRAEKKMSEILNILVDNKIRDTLNDEIQDIQKRKKDSLLEEKEILKKIKYVKAELAGLEKSKHKICPKSSKNEFTQFALAVLAGIISSSIVIMLSLYIYIQKGGSLPW